MQSRFIISLDFELLWGVRDKRTIESYGRNILGVREVIPALLDLFDEFGIHASFATVGFLFAHSREEILSHSPGVLPDYVHDRLSPYANNYLNQIGKDESQDQYHFAGSLIDMIRQHPDQEISTHTFSHYYCLEGASIESFEQDLKAALAIAASRQIELKSIIFPRNQYSAEHLAVCSRHGLIAFRGNEKSILYKPRKNEDQNKLIRGLRLADSYINLTGAHSFQPVKEQGMINTPASRFLRPYSSRLKSLEGMRLRRINQSLTEAALRKESYHLWWHPHNFGRDIIENLSFLRKILEHYRQLKSEYGMESRNMKEVAAEILGHAG